MSKIWIFIILSSTILYILTGNSSNFIVDITSSSKDAITNVIELIGIMCFWSGIFNILENTDIIRKISNKFSFIFLKLFKKEKLTEDARKYISLNIISNVLGVGNAATINGIKAMEEMQKSNEKIDSPSDNMAIFIILNTASLQLLPTSMIGIRAMYGAKNPADIVGITLISSICSLIVGLVFIKILNKKFK